MIHVLADTTAYRADPRREKAGFRTLLLLASAGLVRLHIPEVVRREYTSQQRGLYAKNVTDLLRALEDLGRRPLPKHAGDFVEEATQRVTSLRAELATFADEEFERWGVKAGAQIHKIGEMHGARVIEAYFAGTPPFRQAKSRDDFPDAFLWEAICEINGTHRPLYLISSDDALFRSVETSADVVAFKTLEEFIASDACQAVLQAHFATTNFKSLIEMLPDHLSIVSAGIAEGLVPELAGETVQSEQFPEEGKAVISMVGEPRDLQLDTASAVDHGEGLVVIPFSLKSECLLEYPIFKGDYYSLPDDRITHMSTSELNDHYLEAEEYFDLSIDGLLSIEVNTETLKRGELDQRELLYILRHAVILIDSVEDIHTA